MRRNLMKLFKLCLAVAIAALAVVGVFAEDAERHKYSCTVQADTSPGGSQEPLLVVASIYPMQYFAERVGSDRVEVVALVPPRRLKDTRSN